MAVEFHNREFPCATDSIIPAGSGYTNSAYQTCAYQSMQQGQMSLQGDGYIAQQFGFSYANIGRNFAILVLFSVALIAINMWLVEKIDWADSGGGALEYARQKGEAAKPPASPPNDEENIKNKETPTTISSSSCSPATSGILPKSNDVFSWRDLTYTVPYQDGEKRLLNGVSGYCEPGNLTALVGASGAGKSTCEFHPQSGHIRVDPQPLTENSTVMTVLTQQATGSLTGQMMVNNQPVGPSFGQSIGYCQQMDIHIETSTVREAFEFSAILRQSRTTLKSDKLAYVDQVLNMLQMADLQNVVIQSLSLEQKKRVTIGVELCAKPSLLLFLDEPTSVSEIFSFLI